MMKKTMLFAALAAIALISCDRRLDIQELPEPGDSSSVFTASTEGTATKTALEQDGEQYNVNWQNGDRITIVDAESHAGVYTTTSTTTQGSFTYVSESGSEAVTDPYKAWYPAGIYNGGTPALPATQDYVAGNISGSPMYAESGTSNLAFKNIAGIIRLNISTTQSDKKVRWIELSANQGMSGAISNAATLASSEYAAAVSGTAGVTLDCGESGVAIGAEATAFHIAVPANTYTGLKITVVTTDGEVQTRTAKSGIEITRSCITTITLSFGSLAPTTGSAIVAPGVTQDWVQLWPGGPKWAKFNIGSTISSYAGVTEYNTATVGGYYSYRGSADSVGGLGFSTPDTGAYFWGLNWATPTGAQLEALIANCNWTYCDGSTVQYETGCTLAGWKVEGTEEGYTANSIFLPFSGMRNRNESDRESEGIRGCYWSLDCVEANGYFINLTSEEHSYGTEFGYDGLSVRAICVNNYDYVDLSSSAYANCYIVPQAGLYKFDARKKGNLSFIDEFTNIASVELLWVTKNESGAPQSGEVIQAVTLSDDWVYFSTGAPYREGNALVAIKNYEGTIRWSWHLWFESDDLVALAQEYNKAPKYLMMDRNLGALTNCYGGEYDTRDFGFAYQNGRKDPFLTSSRRTSYMPVGVNGTHISYSASDGSLENSIKNPTVVYGTDVWGGDPSNWDNYSKTQYDPCPPGWRVPPTDIWTRSGFSSETLVPYGGAWGSYHGYLFKGMAWYPATGDLWGNSYNNVGSTVRVWACGGGNSLAANGGGGPTLGDGSNPGHGYSVRCMRVL
ncbi:MAG: hypothetical protein IJU27_03365 [Bacteroidales bacterium]|nr:hypothetical protein [Bacteroidales bacterium]